MLFHNCTPDCQPGCSARAPRTLPGPDRDFTVDLHCHALVPGVEALVADTPQKRAEPELMLRAMGKDSVEHNQQHMLPIAGPRLTSLETRLADMETMGVDVQIVSPSPTQYYYWAGEELAEQIVRTCNEGIAGLCESHPDRLAGLATVALQHPDQATQQLTYAVKQLGFKGVEISTSVNDLESDNPSLERFWAKADELAAVVFVHPFGTSLGKRVNRYYLQNVIGQPLETTIALSSLIFGGVFDRHPGLRIVAAHGGGYLPTYCGRSDHAHAVRPEAGHIDQFPREYLKKIWFDTVVYSPLALEMLVEAVGVSQVVSGTDYPFDMGFYDLHGLLADVPNLTDKERAQILGGNACELLGLEQAALHSL